MKPNIINSFYSTILDIARFTIAEIFYLVKSDADDVSNDKIFIYFVNTFPMDQRITCFSFGSMYSLVGGVTTLIDLFLFK